LLLVENLHWVQRQSDLFNTVVQSGAVLAVLLVFTGRVRQLAGTWREPATQRYLGQLALAFGLTVVGGMTLKHFGFRLPKDAAPVAWATLLGGGLILGVERWLRHRELRAEVTWLMAVVVGVAQLVAGVFPGTSRSGATILFALVLGLNRTAATEFSFLLGIPTLLAAGAAELYQARQDAAGEHWGLLLLGTAVAALTAFAVVKWLLRFIQTHTFEVFGWYRIALGALILVFFCR
jgi:undecaprenyl-diphosphatase